MSITAYTKGGKRAYRAKVKHQGRQHTRAGFATKAEARAWMVETVRALKSQATAPPPQISHSSTFSAASVTYLEDCAARMQAETVREKFRHLSTFALSVDGPFDLSAVLPITCQSHIAAVQREAGNKTANRHLRTLKAMWNWCARRGLVVGNPWTQVEPYPEDKPVPYVPPPEDVAAVLMACKPWERDFLSIVLRTGARAGEIRKLSWDDVDLSRSVLTLWTRKRKGGSRQPRPLTMSPQLRDIMRRLWEQRDRKSPYVFPGPDGGHLSRQAHSVKFMLPRLCDRAGVKPFGLHSLRHYVAVRLRDSGKASKFDIQAILGHQRSDTTDIYLRGLAPDLGGAVAALDDEDAQTCTPDLYPLGRR